MRPVNGAVLVGTALWRLTIAAFAFVGWWLYGHDFAQLPFLTQSGNLLVALVYLGLAVYYPLMTVNTGREPGEGRIRGAMTLLMMVVGCTYMGVMGGDASEAKDLLTHVITPLLVFVDWCFVGRSQNRCRPWHPLVWLIIPAVWLVGYSATGGYEWVRGGSPLYGFADPGEGSYPGVLAGLVLATVAGAYLLFGIAKLKGSLAASGALSGQPVPGGPQPAYGPPPGHPQQPWQQPQPYVQQPHPQQAYPQQPPPQQPPPQQPPAQQPRPQGPPPQHHAPRQPQPRPYTGPPQQPRRPAPPPGPTGPGRPPGPPGPPGP